MQTMKITYEAYQALRTLTREPTPPRSDAPDQLIEIWLREETFDRLRRHRLPDEGYSATILRLHNIFTNGLQ